MLEINDTQKAEFVEAIQQLEPLLEHSIPDVTDFIELDAEDDPFTDEDYESVEVTSSEIVHAARFRLDGWDFDVTKLEMFEIGVDSDDELDVSRSIEWSVIVGLGEFCIQEGVSMKAQRLYEIVTFHDTPVFPRAEYWQRTSIFSHPKPVDIVPTKQEREAVVDLAHVNLTERRESDTVFSVARFKVIMPDLLRLSADNLVQPIDQAL